MYTIAYVLQELGRRRAAPHADTRPRGARPSVGAEFRNRSRDAHKWQLSPIVWRLEETPEATGHGQ